MSTKSAMIASAVAGLFLTATPALAAEKAGGKVHCQGVNACKGKGWVEMTDKKCKDKGGTVAEAEEKK
jgi:hypothetical protein